VRLMFLKWSLHRGALYFFVVGVSRFTNIRDLATLSGKSVVGVDFCIVWFAICVSFAPLHENLGCTCIRTIGCDFPPLELFVPSQPPLSPTPPLHSSTGFVFSPPVCLMLTSDTIAIQRGNLKMCDN
jgi:hypothetical protein